MKKVIQCFFVSVCVIIAPFAWGDAGDTSASGSGTKVVSSGGTNAGGSTIQADEFTGAATYSIAIPVPPARGGLQPQLNLNYNSFRKNANSWVGYGWELDVGSIERLPESGVVDYHDGESFQVRLSGQTETLRLKQSDIDASSAYGITAPSGCSTDVYESKIESAFNIYLHFTDCSADETDQDEGWQIIDKGGMSYYFGSAEDSREETLDCTSTDGSACSDEQWIARWLLDRVEDPNGNEMTVTYAADLRPYLISYQDISVVFDRIYYWDEDFVLPYFPTFREGFLSASRIGVLLDNITVSDSSGRLLKYDFDYEVSAYNGVSQLTSITQYGTTDAEALPSTTFAYYDQTFLAWETTPHEMLASSEVGGDYLSKGFLNYATQFVDMNGDGLLDKVVASEDSDVIRVFYNDGSDFIYISGKSDWTDPLGADPCVDVPSIPISSGSSTLTPGNCTGHLNAYARYPARTSEDQQVVYLLDINGDSLADRVKAVSISDDITNQRNFEIYLNNGSGWDASSKTWIDPAISDYSGFTNTWQGFVDMNGDGLVDRIQGDESENGFHVYYNTGTSFNETETFWSDPSNDIHDDAAGYISYANETGTYASIKDFNGDGLPDRMLKGELETSDGETVTGLVVFLNRNGIRWAPVERNSEDHVVVNGIDVIFINDPSSDEKGYTNNTHDWIDFNGDGFLDRVVGDDESTFTVYFFNGFTSGNSYSEMSAAYTFADPLSDEDVPDDCDRAGRITAYHSSDDAANEGYFNYHTLTMDINGDGYPDRVAVDECNNDNNTKHYQVYYMQVNAVAFSDAPTEWANQNVSQPVGALKSMDDGMGNRTVIEYQPSSWPTIWNSDGLPITHRFLPFSVYLTHKIYSNDYTLSGSDTAAEAVRNPGMRWVTYDYYGGNYYVRLPSFDTTHDYFTQFNGFQEVVKTPYRATGETWEEYWTTTVYHQSLGDIDTIDAADETYFEALAYDHFAYSGKPYLSEVAAETYTLTSEESTYAINADTTADALYDCTGPCFPRLSTHTKTVVDSAGATPRVSSIQNDYDETNGNLNAITYFDGSGNTILTQSTEYYGKSSFSTSLQIQDRPSVQTKTDSSGNVLRKKEFDYDSRGNPTTERVYSSSTAYQQATRTFNSNGTMRTMTDIDGVTTTFGYDADGLFPTTEQVSLPSSGTLVTTRAFERLIGKPNQSTLDSGVSSQTVYDGFGRPSEEFIQTTGGSASTLKSYSYEYVTENVDGWDVTLTKVQTWEPQTRHADTETNPMTISYLDGSGYTLQQCVYTERGNYRLVQSRQQNGGRLEIKTEPAFVTSCDFVSSLSSSVAQYQTTKDFQGRPLLVDPPDGDTGSPVSSITYAYNTDSSGNLVTTITDSAGKTRIETYDLNERLISVTDPNGTEMEYEYNAVGDLTRVTQGSTTLTTIGYDLMGRHTSMWDANLGTWTYHYDVNGRMDYQIDGNGQRIDFDYDSLGRIYRKHIYAADGSLEKYEAYTYDSGDSTHDVIEGELYRVIEYDSVGTALRVTLFGYDVDYRRVANVTRTIPEVGDFEQTVTNDFRGMTQSTVYPGGESVYYQYTKTGSLENMCSISTCDTSSQYYHIDAATAYNEFGSLLQETYGNGVVKDFTYFANSHRLQQFTLSRSSDSYAQRSYTYDIDSNILSLSDPLSRTGTGALNSAVYDRLSRLTSYTPTTTGRVQTLSYDDQGNITANSFSFGTDAYVYGSSKPHAVTAIGSRSFTYDDNGNMLSDPDRTMTYNAQNQLTKVVMTNGNVIDYDYDYTGARVSKKVTTDASTSATTYYLGNAIEIRDNAILLSLFANNQKLIVKNMGTVDEILGATSASFRNVGITPNIRFATLVPWLLLGFMFFVMASLRPIRARPVWAYAFIPSPHAVGRGLGRGAMIPSPHASRFTLHVARFYLLLRFKWSSYTHAIEEAVHTLHLRPAFKLASFVLMVLMLAQFPILKAYAGDYGSAPGQASDATYTYYVHGDHLGSAHLLTEGQSAGGKHVGLFYNQGDLIQRIEYNPYGQETYVLNPNLSFDPSFTGQTYDIESGLYYFNARYYNPQLGRFIQADTVVPSATDFQSYNRYAYARNNPLKYVDPSGHSFKSMFAAFLGALIGIIVGIATIMALPATIAPLVAFMIAGAAAGAAGGLVSGLIMGGIKGAIVGCLTGALAGAISAGIAFYGGPTAVAVLMGVGLALSVKAEGWEGIGTFAAGLLGAYCGGQAMGVNIFSCFAKEQPVVGGGEQTSLDLGAEANSAPNPNQTTSVQTSPNQAAAAQQPNVTIEGYAGGVQMLGGHAVEVPPGGYCDLNVSGGDIIGGTGGLLVDSQGNYYGYVGGGLTTPGGGYSITCSTSSVTLGWNYAGQVQMAGAGAVQIGYAGGAWFGEVSPPIPWAVGGGGANINAYYVFPLGY